MAENRSVILGASSGVGRALAERLAECGHHLVIAARDRRDLDALAADLMLRWRSTVHVYPIDLGDPEFDPRGFCQACVDRLGGVDALLLTAAQIDPRDEGPGDLATTSRLVRVNYSSAIQVVSEFARIFEAQASGRLVAISSIAAAAPRGRNPVYASTKAALETYCRGLRHYFAGSAVIVQIYALGYVDTAMSFNQKLLFPIASPVKVAHYISKNLGKDIGLRYYPRFWLAVVLILRHLPWPIYKRLSF